MDHALLAQLGFSSWPMLAWTAAAIIPIAIHLLRRYRRQSVPWAAMQLLQKVIDQQSKRSRLQQLILLLVRVMVLVILALALARPFWLNSSKVSNQLQARPSKLWILMIDTSYSMGYRTGGESRMDRAKQQASQLVSRCPQGDAFALIALDDPAQPIIGTATFDSQSTMAEIQRLGETACGCDLSAAVVLAGDIIADCRANPNMPKDIELVVFSDLGKDTWQSAIDGPVARSLARLRQMANVTVESLADGSPLNSAIEMVTPLTFRPVVGSLLAVDVTVASYGAAVNALPVQLQLDNQVLASQTINIDADQRKSVRFQIPIQSPGYSVLSAVIPADSLPIDNQYDLIIDSTSGNRVMIIESGVSQYNPWRLALRPASVPTSTDDHNVRVVSELGWQALPLKDWNVIVFDDAAIINESQINRLTDFVESGGSLVFAWGDKASASSVGITGAASEVGDSSLGRMLGFEFRSVSESGDWSIDPLDYRSPVIAPFAGFPNSGLLTMPIFRYWKIDKLASEILTDLALTTGEPLIVRKRLGQGWVVSILSAPEDGQNEADKESWNAITTWPSFLPLVQQLVQTISESDAQSSNRVAGQTLIDRLPAFSQASMVKLQRPDQTELRIAVAHSDRAGRSEWSYSGTDSRGIYRITEPAEAQRQFAININPEQSSLQSIDLQSLSPIIGVSNSTVAEANLVSGTSQNEDLMARLLLCLLGGLLVVEMLLAWTIGKRIE